MAAAKSGNGMVLSAVKGALLAAALSLVIILIFAFALQKGWLATDAAPIATPLIKVVSAALAGLVAARCSTGKKLIAGMLAGLIYIAFAFMLFSILSSTFGFSWALLTDMGIGALSGGAAALLRGLIR